MTTANEKVLQHNINDLVKQLYSSYARVKELVLEIDTLKLKVASQQLVIDGLVGEIRERNSRPE